MTSVYDEARYLKALCHSRQGDLEDALRALLPLRGKQVNGELGERIADLRRGLRGVLTPHAVITFLMSFPGQPAQAEARLRDVIVLDPEVSLYYFVLGGALASSGDLEQALEVAEEGLENAADDRQRLGAMAEQIRHRLVGPKLAWAVEAFKEEDYRRAQEELGQVPREWRRIPMVEAFEEYLGQLVRRHATARTLPPKGPFEQVDALYFLLARKEVAEAKALLQGDDPRAAERVLEQALAFVPRFPYVNFLYAVSVYQSVGAWMSDPEDVDFDRQLTRLEAAAGAAEIAATDDEIEQAGELLQAIQGLRAFIAETSRRREAQVREAAVVNRAIEEFQSIMESARDGITGADHLTKLRRRLVKLRDSMPELRRTAVSDAAKKVVGQLEEAVLRNLAQLEQATAYQQCTSEFKEIMDSVEGGIETAEQLQTLHGRLEKLRDKIERAKKEAKDKAAHRALDQLATTVDGHLKQLKKPMAGAEVGTLVQEFNAVMESIGDGIKDEKQLRDVHKRLSALRTKVERAKSDAKDKDARRTLDKLAEAVIGHLGQLDRPMAGPRITTIVEMFNKVMKELNDSGPLSRSDAEQKRQFMEAIRAAARAERSKVSDKNAKDVLDELDRVATQVIRALGG